MNSVRVQPHSIEAETAILGSIIMSYNECISSVDNIQPEYFYKDGHQLIFRAIQSLHRDGKAVDMVSVIEELKKKKTIEKAGGAYYITGLCETIVSSANINQHVSILKKNYDLRRFIRLAEELKIKSYEKTDPDRIREEFSQELIKDFDSNIRIISKDTVVEERKKGLVERIEGNIIGTFSFPSIDKILGTGFLPKKHSIITARTSVGKSTFKSNLTVGQCRNGLSVLIITPEMGFDSEMDVLTSIVSGVPLIDIVKMKNWATVKDGKITAPTNNEKLKRVIKATEEIESWNIHFLDGIINKSKIRQAVAETKIKYGLDIVYIDLFDRIQEVRNEIRNKAQKVTQVLGYLQSLGEEFEVHFSNLVQIRRSAEQRKDRRPMLSDLKESGSFEEEAWTIFGLYREALYDEDAIDDTMEVILMKQKDGPRTTVELLYDKDTLKLTDKEDGF